MESEQRRNAGGAQASRVNLDDHGNDGERSERPLGRFQGKLALVEPLRT